MTHAFTVTLFALAQIVSAWGWGAGLLRVLRYGEPPERLADRALRHVVSAALGLGLVSLFIALVFFVHAPLRACFAAIGLSGLALAVNEVRVSRSALLAGFGPRLRRDALWFAPQLVLFLILWTEGFVPDTAVDTYFYHFAAPNYFLLEGGFAPQDLSLMVHYPLAMELLYAPALAFGLEPAAIQLNVLIAGVVWTGLVALGAKLGGAKAGWIAGLIYLLAPSVITITPTAHVETGATLFFVALMALLLRAWREGDAKAAALAGLAGGWFVGCKLVYGPIVALLFVMLAVGSAIRSFRSAGEEEAGAGAMFRAFGVPGLFALGAAAAYLPWVIKNAIYLGNPFFPIFLDRFETPEAIRDYAGTQFAVHGFPDWEGPLVWLRGAAYGFMELASTGDVSFQLGLLAWIGLCFRTRFKGRAGVYVLLLAAPFLVISHFGSQFVVRWFLPVYAAFTVVAGLAAAELWKRNPRVMTAPAVLLALVLLWNWGTDYGARLTGPLAPRRPWTALSDAGYTALRERMPGREAIEEANRKTPPDGRVLLAVPATIYGGRGLERPFLAGGADWIGMMEDDGMNAEEIRTKLRSEGFTHVLHRSDAAFAERLKLSGAAPERETGEWRVVVSPLEPDTDEASSMGDSE